MSFKVLRQGLIGCVAMILASGAMAKSLQQQDAIAASALPAEARTTLVLIRQGGPYPYPKDGSVFGNYERQLPLQKRGYYREFTVPTPRARHRGARRIIAGGVPPRYTEYFYTADHYASFQRIKEE